MIKIKGMVYLFAFATFFMTVTAWYNLIILRILVVLLSVFAVAAMTMIDFLKEQLDAKRIL